MIETIFLNIFILPPVNWCKIIKIISSNVNTRPDSPVVKGDVKQVGYLCYNKNNGSMIIRRAEK
jgi:hypothetical protein